jgi:hypothetical protein
LDRYPAVIAMIAAVAVLEEVVELQSLDERHWTAIVEPWRQGMSPHHGAKHAETGV